jgi:hypothetical protein
MSETTFPVSVVIHGTTFNWEEAPVTVVPRVGEKLIVDNMTMVITQIIHQMVTTPGESRAIGHYIHIYADRANYAIPSPPFPRN